VDKRKQATGKTNTNDFGCAGPVPAVLAEPHAANGRGKFPLRKRSSRNYYGCDGPRWRTGKAVERRAAVVAQKQPASLPRKIARQAKEHHTGMRCLHFQSKRLGRACIRRSPAVSMAKITSAHIAMWKSTLLDEPGGESARRADYNANLENAGALSYFGRGLTRSSWRQPRLESSHDRPSKEIEAYTTGFGRARHILTHIADQQFTPVAPQQGVSPAAGALPCISRSSCGSRLQFPDRPEQRGLTDSWGCGPDGKAMARETSTVASMNGEYATYFLVGMTLLAFYRLRQLETASRKQRCTAYHHDTGWITRLLMV